jgi:hypothetical protein
MKLNFWDLQAPIFSGMGLLILQLRAENPSTSESAQKHHKEEQWLHQNESD